MFLTVNFMLNQFFENVPATVRFQGLSLLLLQFLSKIMYDELCVVPAAAVSHDATSRKIIRITCEIFNITYPRFV